MRIKILLLAAAFVVLASCGTDEDDKTYKLEVPTRNNADVKRLMSTFNEAWNRKDSAALMNLIADDAVILAGRDKVSGKNEIAEIWLRNTLPVTNNLKITDVQNGAGPEIAYSAGTWTMDLMVPGQPVAASSGNHTFVWKRVADSTWKLTLINIEDYASLQP